MASPMTTGSPAAYGWPPAPPSQQMQGPPPANDTDEMGMQVRPMALKVLYTFDKDSRVNCLARWPQTLQVQVVPIDERSWIGIVDLRLCIQAIAQGSPELTSQSSLDYAIYAVDYSEPDTPLVGQGMLSWVMDPAAALAANQFDEGPKMVTGRVTKNMMALFGNGVRETLEVRLKLSEVARMARTDSNSGHRSNGMNASQGSQMHNAPTPTDTTEGNSFLQANPMLGRSASISTMQSPNMAPALPDLSAYPPSMPTGMSATGSFDMGPRVMSRPGSRPNSRQSSKSAVPPSHPPARAGPSSLPPQQHQQQQQQQLQQQQQQPNSAFNSVSPPPISMPNDELMSASTPPPETSIRPARPSRPSSRSRSRQPTGRPRGRPRKSNLTDGNTSAAEEAPTDADGDDAHKKKRVKTTKADYPTRTSLDSAPDSLRVAASTSGALRTLRPILPHPSTDGPTAPGSHLQEYPRAPTPVPQADGPLGQNNARKMMAQKARRESLANLDSTSFTDQYARSLPAGSPTDSIAPSPENYTPEDSPADMNSSPPVPRTTSYVPRSSPIPSSPPLPAMRMPQPDSGFMSGGMDDLLFDDDESTLLNDKLPPPPTPLDTAAPTPNMEFAQPLPPTNAPATLPPQTSTAETSQPMSAPAPAPAPSDAPVSKPARAPKQSNRSSNKRPAPSSEKSEQYPFLAMNPGPPELLPTTVLYNPPQPRPRPAKIQRANSMAARPPPPPLERSHSEPAHLVQPDQHQNQQQAEPQLAQRPPSQLRHQSLSLPSDLPSEIDMEADANQNRVSQFSQIDVPDDMKELQKLLAASNDGSIATPSESTDTAQPTLPQQPAAGMARMMSSLPPLPFPSRATTVPASDPPALPPLTLPAPPPPPTAFSEAPCPPSDADVPNGRSSKNLVRKAAIRERLKKAIQSGEMPPYCQNCGAIETPTWRKMWTQEHDGEPGFYDFSDKNCPITFVEILERDAEGKSTRYRLVRKALSSSENGKLWTQMLLCNPCGIWLGKFKSHRPRDRWDKDLSRLEQTRTNTKSRSDSRSRKSRAKSDPQTQLTSEAYFTTDPAGPEDSVPTTNTQVSHIVLPDTPPAAAKAKGLAKLLPAPSAATLPPPPPPASTTNLPKPTNTAEPNKQTENENPISNNDGNSDGASSKGSLQQPGFQAGSNRAPASGSGSAERRGPGSTHSRGSGTADSPIAVDDHFGTTRRLLFPSPRKDGVLKVLGELAVNVIGTVLGSPKAKANPPKFEDTARPETKQSEEADTNADQEDDMEDLFGTPPPSTRPSTPPPKTGNQDSPSFASGSFKTPTRPTPSHRPITRSVSKSIVRSTTTTGPCPQSPVLEGLMLLQRTPSKTPRSVPIPGSATRSRRLASVTPGRQQQQQLLQQQQSLHVPLQLDGVPFDTPLTSTLNQLLSEANDFTTGSPSHGLTDLDLATFANLDSDGLTANFGSVAGDLDFGSYLDTDMALPSSSPLVGRKNGGSSHKHHSNRQHVSFGGELNFEASESLWSDFNDAMDTDTDKIGQTA